MKAVVFDLFHTLTAPESAWSELPSTCDLLGVDRRRWDGLITTGSRWRLAGEERDPCRIVARLAREIDPEIADALIERAAATRVLRMRHALERIPPENVATLRRLRQAGFALGLVSNADAIEHGAWRYSPLAGLFDVEVFSCEAGCVKPEPAIFQKCLDALSQRPQDCLFVGDGGSNELAAARALGMKTALVSGALAEFWPEKIAERMQYADHHIRWVPEIEALLGLGPVMHVVEAGGLTLEPQSVAHVEEMFAVLSDPRIYEFENEPPKSLEWLRQRFARLETRRSADRAEQWLNWVIRVPSGELAGYVQATVRADCSAGIAYELASRYWGRGLGTRAVQAMMRELTQRYQVRKFTAVLKRDNARSRRLLMRLGFADSVHDDPPAGIDEVRMCRPA